MAPPPVFSPAARFAVRVPLLPRERAGDLLGPPAADDDSRALASALAGVMADGMVADAIAVANPPLAAAVSRALARPEPRAGELRRLLGTVRRYVLRMTSRPTPLGLFAGVALGGFDRAASASLCDGHSAVAVPDRGWLAGVVERLERTPAVLGTLDLRTSDLVTARGGQLVLAGRAVHGSVREVRLPDAGAVRTAVDAARRPVPHATLVETLRAAHPQERPGAVERLVQVLVTHGVLRTDLRTTVLDPDPLGLLLRRLDGVSGVALLDELRALAGELAPRSRLAPGSVTPALRPAVERMARLGRADTPLHVDLAISAGVTLPPRLGEDLAAAASFLWRVRPERPAPLRAYHQAFLDRYGYSEQVPPRELLDPRAGLGVPEEYTRPDLAAAPAAALDGTLGRILVDLLVSAVAGGDREVVVSDAMLDQLDQLDPDPGGAGDPPACTEVYATVVARTVADIGAGDYRAVLGPKTGDEVGGASLGRFRLAVPGATALLRELAEAASALRPGTTLAQLRHLPDPARLANLAAVGDLVEPSLHVDAHRGAADPALDVDDLVVGASPAGLHLRSARLGCEVLPVKPHMLHADLADSHLARFLADLGGQGVRPLRPWSWFHLEDAPFLPRVRHGCVVLRPARWRPAADLLGRATGDARGWRHRLDAWRDRWAVPERVLVGRHDSTIPLDLTDPIQVELMREECRRRPDLAVLELPGGEDRADGWLAGPDGGHAVEVVVPLLARSPAAEPPAPADPVGPAAPAATRAGFLPGGPWLSARIALRAEDQPEVLSGRLDRYLSPLLSAGDVDRWFLVRFPEPDPHLRLRLHGDPSRLWTAGLAGVRDLVLALRADGYGGGFVLDEYVPETSRYGGADLVGAAEDAFCADSALAVGVLGLAAAPRSVPVRLLAVATTTDLVTAMLGRDGGRAWWLARERVPLGEAARAERRALVTGDHTLDALAPSCRAAADRRRAALAAYRRGLDRAGVGGGVRDRIVADLVHMHVNRLLGVHRPAELELLSLARAVVQARPRR